MNQDDKAKEHLSKNEPKIKAHLMKFTINRYLFARLKEQFGFRMVQEAINSLEEDLAYIQVAMSNCESPSAKIALELAETMIESDMNFLKD